MPPSIPPKPDNSPRERLDSSAAIEAIGHGFTRLERHLLDAPQEINDDGTITPPRLGMISTVRKHMEEDETFQAETVVYRAAMHGRVTQLEEGHKQILEAIKAQGKLKIPGTRWRIPIGVVYALLALAALVVLRMNSADLRGLGEHVADGALRPAPVTAMPRPRDGGP